MSPTSIARCAPDTSSHPQSLPGDSFCAALTAALAAPCQFLFRKRNVGQSKAEVATEAVLKMNPHCKIKHYCDNVMKPEFGVPFVSKFDVVMNALDNLGARRHMNRLCLAADKPLIESGTTGYLGQVSVHLPHKTECFECTEKPTPKVYPICTLASTPNKPIHLVHWGKMVYETFFGVYDAENAVNFLSEGSEDEKKEPSFNPLKAPAAAAAEGSAEPTLSNERVAWAQQVYTRCFHTETERLLSMEDLWMNEDGTVKRRKSQVCNLRGQCFHMEALTPFKAKEMAGNIIAAIASTNAIIAAMIVLEGIKVLQKRTDECKSTFLTRKLMGRRSNAYLSCQKPMEPNKKCAICGTAIVIVTLDTKVATLEFLVSKVLKGAQGFVVPNVSHGANEMIFGTEEVFDEEEGEEGAYAKNMARTLADWNVGDGAAIDVDDDVSELKLKVRLAPSLPLDRAHVPAPPPPAPPHRWMQPCLIVCPSGLHLSLCLPGSDYSR